MQNTSSAVMAQRREPRDSLDFYPTPLWATRALCVWLRARDSAFSDRSAWDPACGEHDMVRPLREFFASVHASDIAPHKGGHEIADFLWPTERRADFIITNPPFRLAENFALKALVRSNCGASLLVRTAFLEGIGRYERLFSLTPPSDILQFTQRVVMHHGKLSQHGSTATAYCWVVWLKHTSIDTRFHWIPPCRKTLERAGDWPEDAGRAA